MSKMRPNDKNIKTISNAVSIQVRPANNSGDKSNAIAEQLKYVILLIAGLGVNRTYLLNYRRYQQWALFVYCVFINVATVCVLVNLDTKSAFYKVMRDTSCIEYVLLVVIALIAKKSSMRNFLDDLYSFDGLLKINDDLNITLPTNRVLVWVFWSLLYAIIEYIMIIIYVLQNNDLKGKVLAAVSYIALTTHDIEQVLICSLLRTVLMRVRILKAHVAKVLADGKETKRELDKVEALSNKAQLDINSLHRNYELLHKCAEQLNSIMSLPMMIMLLYSGLTTIMLLKSSIQVIQISPVDNMTESTIVVNNIIRCVKYTVLVVIPCYYSSVTTSQVAHLRTMLHDAMNSAQVDKLERRRIKAFFQLTRESEFAYALWGVIRLNMSLPLSYLSLCTTYLVIVIQFSKFID